MAGCAPTPEVGRSPGTAPTFATRAGRGVATSCHTSVGVCRRPSPSVTSSMRQWRLHDPLLTPPDNLMTVHHHKCQQNVCRALSVLQRGHILRVRGTFLCGRGHSLPVGDVSRVGGRDCCPRRRRTPLAGRTRTRPRGMSPAVGARTCQMHLRAPWDVRGC